VVKSFVKILSLITLPFLGGCTLAWVQERIPPPIEKNGKVFFQLDAPSAKSVYIAGEFNGCEFGAGSPRAIKMEKNEKGIWQASVEIPSGRYQYKFVLDNYTWILDPHNPLTVDDGRGNINSLLIVK